VCEREGERGSKELEKKEEEQEGGGGGREVNLLPF
jgi:hypothetical protein